MKNISIITNFGCDKNCWYCVWKGHKLSNCRTIDYSKLDEFLVKYKNLGKVSLSGGGDPLYNYFENITFWKYLINRCKDLDIKIDIHTRVVLPKQNFWRKHINRAVISIDKVTPEIINDLTYLKELTKVRVYHTITEFTNIEDFISLRNKGFDITMKQLYGYDDLELYAKYKEKCKDMFYFLDEGDYNIYYMPDNNEYNSFSL